MPNIVKIYGHSVLMMAPPDGGDQPVNITLAPTALEQRYDEFDIVIPLKPSANATEAEVEIEYVEVDANAANVAQNINFRLLLVCSTVASLAADTALTTRYDNGEVIYEKTLPHGVIFTDNIPKLSIAYQPGFELRLRLCKLSGAAVPPWMMRRKVVYSAKQSGAITVAKNFPNHI